MKLPTYLCLLICIQVFLHCDARSDSKQRDMQKWRTFKGKFRKSYTTGYEETRRMKIFLKNMRKIDRHNKRYKEGKETYRQEMNQFSDMTREEFAKMYLSDSILYKTNTREPVYTPRSFIGDPPETKNWVEEGVVTSVKSQGGCGCCWAFVAAAAIESHVAIGGGSLTDLSAQNLLDCVGFRHGIDNTCSGGVPELGFEYVIENKGIATWNSYPYETRQGPCRYRWSEKRAGIESYKYVKANEDTIKRIVGTVGPVTAAIYNSDMIEYYREGIFDSPRCGESQENSHGFVIVGYGTESGMDYWLVKNSWGPNWGLDGYMKIARNKNMCNITISVVLPILVS